MLHNISTEERMKIMNDLSCHFHGFENTLGIKAYIFTAMRKLKETTSESPWHWLYFHDKGSRQNT